MSKQQLIPVIACGAHKGQVVLFGWARSLDRECDGSIVLERAQMLVEWVGHGLGAMAATGPGSGCHVGPPVPRAWLADVRCIMQCTKESVEKWEAQPW